MDHISEAQKIWSMMTAQVSDELVVSLPTHFDNKLRGFFSVGAYYYYIFNLKLSEVENVSPSVKEVLGFPPDYFRVANVIPRIHPEDVSWFLDFENAATEFLQQLPKEKVGSYKIRYDYRIKNNLGHYIRVLHQAISIQEGYNGEVVRAFCVHTHITHIKSDGVPTLSFIGLEGEPSYIHVKVKTKFKAAKDVLTKKEKEILLHFIDGKSSQEIADILFLSKHTVDTHRRNMIRKTGSQKNTDLVANAVKKGYV